MVTANGCKKKATRFEFLHSPIFYIRRKYWNRENFRLPVFNGFTRFGMS